MKRIISVLLTAVMLIAASTAVLAVKPSYTDVKSGQWFYDDIMWVRDNYYGDDLMSGGDPIAFKPNGILTRADAVSFFYLIEGMPEAAAPADASWAAEVSGKSYASAVAWAYSAGIINGFPDGSFRPNEPVTREQLAKIISLYAEHHDAYKASSFNLSAFKDASSVRSWARGYIAFAVENGIIIGRTKTTIAPRGTATRAECCTMLRRVVEKFDLAK